MLCFKYFGTSKNLNCYSCYNISAKDIASFFEVSEKVYSKFHYFPLDFQLKMVYNFIVWSSRLKQPQKADLLRKDNKIQLKSLIF